MQYGISYDRKKFYCTNPCSLHYKTFTIIIYDRNDSTIVTYNRNDSGQYYTIMILANLALARSANYNHKLRCKLK